MKCFPHTNGYGIAYHKVPLFNRGARGARPVVYGDKSMLAVLPEEMKYLFMTYDPSCFSEVDPVDFTWEREWRIAPRDDRFYFDDNLELTRDTSGFPNAAGAVIVRYDKDVSEIREKIRELAAAIMPSKNKEQNWQNDWPRQLSRIISLETVAKKYVNDSRYARIETYPDDCRAQA